MPTVYHTSSIVTPVNPQNTFKMVVKEPMPQSKCPICARNTLEHYPDYGRWRCLGSKCRSEFFHDDDGTINVRDFDPNFDVHGRFNATKLWPIIRHQIKEWWKQLRTPQPKAAPAPAPIFDLNKEIARIEAEDRQSFAYNPTAIWLAPDRWDGPAGVPFWMNDPKPVKLVTRTSHLPIQPPNDYLAESQLKPPKLYFQPAPDEEFAEFYRSKYKTIGAFRRARTLRNKNRLT